MRRTRPIRLVTATLALVGLLAAACGSDDAEESGSGDTTPVSASDTAETTEAARSAPELTGDPV